MHGELDDAEKAGNYARALFEAKKTGEYSPEQRLVIPNDTKIFAQASSIGALYFVTADTNASKAISLLAKENGFPVIHVDIHTPLFSFSGSLFCMTAGIEDRHVWKPMYKLSVSASRPVCGRWYRLLPCKGTSLTIKNTK